MPRRPAIDPPTAAGIVTGSETNDATTNEPRFRSGAAAFREDLPEAEIHLLDTGHFALEDHAHEIAGHIRRFLSIQLGDIS